MINQYKIFLTSKAHGDLRDIYQYIKEELHNNNSALKIINEIEQNILILKDYPLSGSPVKDGVLMKKGYRKIIINNYIVLYTTDDQDKIVNIIRIIYGKRDYLNLI